VFPLPDGEWGLLIGDVVGRGHEAAALAVTARHTIRTGALAGLTSPSVMQLANESLLAHANDSEFCTATYARIALRRHGVHVRIARSGHPYPLVRRRDGRIEEVATGEGHLLGVLPRARPAMDLVVLDEGDMLVLYTDGVTERSGERGRFGRDGLEAVLATVPASTAEEVVEAVLCAVAHHGDTPISDDTAIMVLLVTG
jgi:phosphoserine phosphatase RsbU/P